MRIDQNSQLMNAQLQQRPASASKKVADEKGEGVAAVVDRMHMDITDQGSGRITNVADAEKLAMSLKDRIFAEASQAAKSQANVNPDFVGTII